VKYFTYSQNVILKCGNILLKTLAVGGRFLLYTFVYYRLCCEALRMTGIFAKIHSR